MESVSKFVDKDKSNEYLGKAGIPSFTMELTNNQWNQIKNKRIEFLSTDGNIAFKIKNANGTWRDTVSITIVFLDKE